MDKERPGAAVVERKLARLAGRTAIRFRIEIPSPKGRVVEEQVLILRCGIIYTIGLQTLRRDVAADEGEFRRIQDGFKLLPLPATECGN
jgi:hypothetical protein